jgi:hypothetical protein
MTAPTIRDLETMSLADLGAEIDWVQRLAEAALIRLDAAACEVSRRYGHRFKPSTSSMFDRMDDVVFETRARLDRLRDAPAAPVKKREKLISRSVAESSFDAACRSDVEDGADDEADDAEHHCRW